MIGSLSDFSEALILDSVFGRTASYSYPGTLYVALFTALPNDAGSSGTEVDTSGTGYARKSIANSSANFNVAADGVKVNKNAITFATSTTAWGDIVGAGIYDASTGGNLLWYWEWTQPRSVGANDTMRVEAEELEFTFTAEDTVNADCVLSLELQHAWLDAFFGTPGAPAIPATLYAALMTTIPDPEDASGVELTGTSYARVAIDNTSTNFSAYASGVKTNAAQIVWPTTGGSWSSVVGVAFYDASSSGNLIAKLKTASTLSWVAGDQPRIAAGTLPIYAN